MTKKKITAKDLKSLIVSQYSNDAHLVYTEVRSKSGYKGSTQVRYIDAMMLGVYPSHGFRISGFEVKISKSDLKKELDDGMKSTTFQRHCNEWWLVVSSEKIIKDLVLPSTWGIMIPNSSCTKLVIKKKPTYNKEPEQMPHSMYISLLRNAAKNASVRANSVLENNLKKARENESKAIQEKLEAISELNSIKESISDKDLIDMCSQVLDILGIERKGYGAKSVAEIEINRLRKRKELLDQLKNLNGFRRWLEHSPILKYLEKCQEFSKSIQYMEEFFKSTPLEQFPSSE